MAWSATGQQPQYARGRTRTRTHEVGVPPRSTDKIPRYSRHKDFYHYGFEDVSNMLGTPVPKETPTENAARATWTGDHDTNRGAH